MRDNASEAKAPSANKNPTRRAQDLKVDMSEALIGYDSSIVSLVRRDLGLLAKQRTGV
jgi:hypothetical protein